MRRAASRARSRVGLRVELWDCPRTRARAQERLAHQKGRRSQKGGQGGPRNHGPWHGRMALRQIRRRSNATSSFHERQTSGFHCLQTCSACADNRPETISGGGPKTSGSLFDKSSSLSTPHFEYPPITGKESSKTTRPIPPSLAGNEPIPRPSTTEHQPHPGPPAPFMTFSPP